MALVLFYHQTDISIHALREEGDEYLGGYRMPINVFLSTPSARRATYTAWGMKCLPAIFLSTPSARRATSHQMAHGLIPHISIHALREEGDPGRGQTGLLKKAFLSTPSARRATSPALSADARQKISIHALREEGDATGT